MAHESDGALARKTPELPEGYEDEAAFLAEVRERYSQGLDADRENREAALDDMRFLAGEQWDKAYEKSRLESGRPCLTINRLPQFVAQVVGDIRINRPGIKVRPAEDADLRLAQVREGLIRAIERESDAQAVYAVAGQAQVACGIGAFRVGLGKHAQRIAALEERTRDAGAAQAAIAVLTATVAAMNGQLGEIRQDVKNLLTGRVRPAARRPDE